MTNRVVLTGLSVISPVGIGLEKFWEAISTGKSGIEKIEKFDTSAYPVNIAGEVKDFDPSLYIEKKEARRMDRFTQFSVSAAKMALEDAGLTKENIPQERAGVIIGCGIGGMETFEETAKTLFEKGPGRVSPFFIPMMIGNIAPGQVAIELGIKGPNMTVMTACASGTNAIGEAFLKIKHGEADMIITGGTEAAITPLALAGFCSMKALSTRNIAPEKASCPFSAERDGFVMAEGAGLIILESLQSALQRNARIYAEILGYGATADAYHITAPAPGGTGASSAIKKALAHAGLEPEKVDYINAHGTSTELNDKYETMAIKDVFGERAYKLAISSTKSMTGHLLGAAGGVELVATALAIKYSLIPPTINYEKQDADCDLDYVPNVARRHDIKYAMSNSFGFGGQNASILIGKYKA